MPLTSGIIKRINRFIRNKYKRGGECIACSKGGMSVKRKGKQRLWLHIAIVAPILTVTMAMLCAWLMLRGSLQEEKFHLAVAVIGGLCGFLLSLYTVLRVPRKKLLWGMVTSISYGMALLLGNLLFFGESYGELGGVLLPILGGGAAASLLGTLRSRKIA